MAQRVELVPHYENQLRFNVDFPQSVQPVSKLRQPGPIVIEKYSPCLTPPPKKSSQIEVLSK